MVSEKLLKWTYFTHIHNTYTLGCKNRKERNAKQILDKTIQSVGVYV